MTDCRRVVAEGAEGVEGDFRTAQCRGNVFLAKTRLENVLPRNSSQGQQIPFPVKNGPLWSAIRARNYIY